MKKHLSKKRVVLAAIVVVALGIASGVAYAYWTSTGTGSVGSATAGTGVSFTATLSGSAPTGLVPGGSDQAIDVKVTNPATFPQTLSGLTVSVKNGDGSAWILVPGCFATDFSITQPTVVAAPILAGGNVVISGAKIHMVNDLVNNQNACKGASVPLYF